MLIMSFYFGGRTLEKIMGMKDQSRTQQTEIKDAK
jgi:hypothetical protein